MRRGDSWTGAGEKEDAAERVQRPAVDTARIGPIEAAGVFAKELVQLPAFQGLKDRQEPRAAGPFENRRLALQDVQVFGLPDLELRRPRRQKIVVVLGRHDRDRKSTR